MSTVLSILLLTLLTHAAEAQVTSCWDVGCPSEPGNPYSLCYLDHKWLNTIGVSNFTTALSPEPLLWTIGFSQGPSADNDPAVLDSRIFYLGQPPSSDLRSNNSVNACALFFDDVKSQLKFNYSETSTPGNSKGSCNDALTDACVSDLAEQAKLIASRSNAATFSCESIANELTDDPPTTCKIVETSWGKITSQAISGPEMPNTIPTSQCDMTMYGNYSQTQIFTTNTTETDTFSMITPVLTVMRMEVDKDHWAFEAHLSCLKPVGDTDDSSAGFDNAAPKAHAQPVVELWLPIVGVLYWLLQL